ncbi:MAG: membrane protein insertase YidC [Planctomycetaceae bacterium]|nr:membrane protein insertase YidC [Planctomycetaceae bacterium]
MERRFVLFLVLSFVILAVSYSLTPQRPKKATSQQAPNAKSATTEPKQSAAEPKASTTPSSKKAAAEKREDKKKAAATIQAEPESPEHWITLGSADPKAPYRMLVTLTNRGAAVTRIELNSPHSSYCDIDDRSGYLGHVAIDSAFRGGCLVQVVGAGTPADEAGLKPGDVMTGLETSRKKYTITDRPSLEAALAGTRPKQTVTLSILRNGQPKTLPPVKLRRRPLEVVKPENGDPLSMLLTLDRVDDLKLSTQWARDVAVYRLSDELKLSHQELADLDLNDVRLAPDSGKLRVRAEDPDVRQWVSLSEAARHAMNAWQTQRGDQPGPLFLTLPCNESGERLTAADIRRIVVRVRTEEQESGQTGAFAELDGVNLRHGTWRLIEHDVDHAVFRRTLPQFGLELTKIYRLVRVPEASQQNDDFPAYHLEFDVEIRNVSGEARTVAYRLDGPTGLPTEGYWYATRVTRTGGSGLRDFIISFNNETPGMVGAITIAGDKPELPRPDKSLTYVGVDAQYFSAVLMPQRKNPADIWFDELMPIRVGRVDQKHPNLTDVSCRLVGVATPLRPDGKLVNRFKLFAGPKKPSLLENSKYRLGDLIYFGWPIFAAVAVPLTYVLHGFFFVVRNYGLAIILLTAFVRGCMFPLSRKQTLGMQKMQQLQPEIKKIQEKHKNNPEARTKAQQELFRKHNYNPLAGCLPIFIQIPVFMGLYRALMVAIELRDAPLISHGVRWCSNLAAPDMLFSWQAFMPNFIVNGPGMFWLGPYFNLLPILTIVLFIWQQKVLTPPAADEQAAMQQKMMQYMMIFMGLLFYKVASGLCIYFVASSLWSIAERQFLPKPLPPAGGAETRAQVKARARQAAEDAAKTKKKSWWKK